MTRVQRSDNLPAPMVLFNYGTKEITAKIVYYGPGLCGKTTNLQFVYESLPSNNKSKMLSLATKTDRTLFFDFLPLDLGKIRGMRTKLQLYTVPGQVYYNSTRQLVLKGADGVVFVADSQESALDANIESLQNLEDNLKRQGIRIAELPVFLQYNKRDLPNILSVADLNTSLNRFNSPTSESVATTGIGVEQTLRGVTQLVLNNLVKKYGLEGSGPLEKEIQILNPTLSPDDPASSESVWADDVLATEHMPAGNVLVEGSKEGEKLPLVATELVDSAPAKPATPTPGPAKGPAAAPAKSAGPFDELIDSSETGEAPPARLSVSLPNLDIAFSDLPETPSRNSVSAPATDALDRRSADGLTKELTIPLNLSLSELKQYRRLRLKITLDVNLLP